MSEKGTDVVGKFCIYLILINSHEELPKAQYFYPLLLSTTLAFLRIAIVLVVRGQSALALQPQTLELTSHHETGPITSNNRIV